MPPARVPASSAGRAEQDHKVPHRIMPDNNCAGRSWARTWWAIERLTCRMSCVMKSEGMFAMFLGEVRIMNRITQESIVLAGVK